MLMVMDPNVNQPTAYVDPYAGGYNAPTSGPVSRRSKIIVVVMIIGILFMVIGGFLYFSSRKDPNLVNMEQIVAIHVEISRVSEVALQSDIITPKGKDLASKAQLVAYSHQTTATNILTKDYKGKADKKLLASAADQANDDRLRQGELIGNIDKAYTDVLKELLAKANTAISQSSGNAEVQAQLESMSASNALIYESITSGS